MLISRSSHRSFLTHAVIKRIFCHRCHNNRQNVGFRNVRKMMIKAAFVSPLTLISFNNKNNNIHKASCSGLTQLEEDRLSSPILTEAEGLLVVEHGKLYWTIVLTARAIHLFILFLPAMVLYPLSFIGMRKLYLLALYRAVLSSGPAVIKLGQWLSTRRDLFSIEFCNMFSSLHTRAIVHPFSHTRRILTEEFGQNWSDFIEIENSDLLGSGCIAQVYRGKLKRRAQKSMALELNVAKELDTGKEIDIAIKIRHPNILEAIEKDLYLLQNVAKVASFVYPSLKYLNPVRSIQDFQDLLEMQLDLRHEGRNLKQFRYHFEKTPNVVFPKPIYYTEYILLETYEKGISLSDFLKNPDKEYGAAVALKGARALLKMIFVDNLVHGDLHPGNILVRLPEKHVGEQEAEDKQEFPVELNAFDRFVNRLTDYFDVFGKHILEPLGKVLLGNDDFAIVLPDPNFLKKNKDGEKELKNPQLVFLDTGISVQMTPIDYHNFKSLFKAVIDGKGKAVGELLLNNSPNQLCKNPEGFKEKVNAIVTEAHSVIGGLREIGKLNTMHLLERVLETSAEFKVGLESNFATIVVAVMLLEGYGRTLNPKLDILSCARPFVSDIFFGNDKQKKSKDQQKEEKETNQHVHKEN